MIAFVLDYHTISGDNDHRGWRKQFEDRIKPQRQGAAHALQAILSRQEPSFIKRHRIPVKVKRGKKVVYFIHTVVSPILIRMTRVYKHPNRKLDSDGLSSALKPTRDGIADALGCPNDDLALLKWEPYQRSGDSNCVEVQIWERAETQIDLADVTAYVTGAVNDGGKLLGGKLRMLMDGKIVDVKVG